jgi:hypothetical protein
MTHDEVEAQQSEHLPHSTSVMAHKSSSEYEAKAVDVVGNQLSRMRAATVAKQLDITRASHQPSHITSHK